jgi:glycosyltransferase involved in cell wall biosynthesis
MDQVVTCSEYGFNVLRRLPEPITSVKMALGVDTGVFHPLPDRDGLKQRYGLEGKFVIGFFGRNQPRKQIPVLIKAFARFAEGKSDVLLYLHTDPDDVGWRLLDLLEIYQLEFKTVLH